MPPNQQKSCRLCGSAKHTLATCKLRGAAEFRKLVRQQHVALKTRGSRVCRGNGEAKARKMVRKPGKKKPAVSQKVRKQRARRSYSGDVFQTGNRKDRTYALDERWQKGEAALATLTALGFLTVPDRCSTCKVGQMLGPVKRYDVQCADSLFYRCTHWECQTLVNVMKFQNWLVGMKRFTFLHPSSLLGIIHAYLSKPYPRPGHAHPMVPGQN